MLLLDQGLPRSTTFYLRKMGIEAVHAGEIGLSTAEDRILLEHALDRRLIVVTLDADFHRQLALAGATGPSVIRVRIEGLRGSELAELVKGTLRDCAEDLKQGAAVSVSENGIRLRRLPLLK
ncbi:MAG: DUF5615 family PIN-like protein [Acidobacteria bacterium]|nr:DUF5615 family PIN-like protein [Acidobacteriota bacterium]